MISLFGFVLLLVLGCVVIRAIPAALWAMIVGTGGLLAACSLLAIFALLVGRTRVSDPNPWQGLQRQAESLWAAEWNAPDAPVGIVVSELPSKPIDLSDNRLSPAQYAAERAEIERLWQASELERRLWHVGSLVGGLFTWLALATAYLKFDLLSTGRYRGRLFIATAVGMIVATAVAAWAWTPPL